MTKNHITTEQKQDKGHGERPPRSKLYLIGGFISLVNGALFWLGIMWFTSGSPGWQMGYFINIVTLAIGVFLSFGFSVYGARQAAEVVYRSCHFGSTLALIIPFIIALRTAVEWTGFVTSPVAKKYQLAPTEIFTIVAGAAVMVYLIFSVINLIVSRRLLE
jgi:hypothetical protein